MITSPEDISHRFRNHPPESEAVGILLDSVTAHMIEIAAWLNWNLPPSREAALALTNLEQASMWAKAAIARHQP